MRRSRPSALRPAVAGAVAGAREGARERLLRPRRIRDRVMRLPLVAGVALGVVLLLTVGLGVATQRRLERLGQGAYPSLAATRELRDALQGAKTALQTAASVSDADRVLEADSIAGVFVATAARARRIVGADTAALDRLVADFRAWHGAAHETTELLLAGRRDATVDVAVRTMMARYTRVRDALARREADDERAIATAFADAWRLQVATWVGTALVTVLAVGLLGVLARMTVRAIVRPLEGAAAVADQLAVGDLAVGDLTGEHAAQGRGAGAARAVPGAAAGDVPDEIARLQGAMAQTVAYLRDMSAAADAIAGGDLSAAPAPRSGRDRFGGAFAAMVGYLRDMAGVAERLASGDLEVTVAPRSARDVFGRSLGLTLEQMAGTIRELRDSQARLEAAEREARDAGERQRLIVETVPETIVTFDRQGRLLSANAAAEALVGRPRAEILGQTREAVVSAFGGYLVPALRPAAYAHFEAALAGETRRFETRIRRPSGEERAVEVAMAPMRAGGAITGALLVARDVTAHAALAAQLAHQAFHDPLTGLANRALLRDRVDHALARERRAGPGDAPRLAVLFLDLDNFKTVNDSLGHDAGDRLLEAVAARLRAATRDCDTVARLGGDEFAVLLENLEGERDAIAVAERIGASMRVPVDLGGRTVHVGGSVGVAFAEPGLSADDLLRNADAAMYGAKGAGKGRHAVFDPALLAAAVDRMELEADLARALDAGELEVHYQPIVALGTGAMVGAEALARWRHPERGLVSPATFIPVAEDTGQIVALGRWVLGEATRQAAAWPVPADGAAPSVTVNASGRQLADPGFVDDVRAALAESGLAPARLTLEITESVIMHDADATLAVLHALKALGVRLAIDDFGTGYSSLSYLQRFPVDVLKIDKAFVDGLAQEGQDAALARTIIALGETLALRTVAEGVEHGAQRAHLQALGCELGQGYLFSRPLPPAALRAWMAAGAGAAGVVTDG